MKPILQSLIRSFVCRRTILAGLSGLVIGSTSGYTLIMWSNRSPAVLVHDEHELASTTVSNGHIDFYVDLDHIRDCPTETSRWLWTWTEHKGEQVKLFYPLANSTTTLTDIGQDQRFILSIPIPTGVWPGQWFYWSKSVEHCSLLPNLFRSAVRESRDIPVRIIAEDP